MHSVMFRRLLIAIIVALLIASFMMVAGYSYFSETIYEEFASEDAISKEQIVRLADRLNNMLLLLSAVVVPMILLLCVVSIRQLTSPLHDMSEAAIKMSKGQFDVRVDEDMPGEVGILSRALNSLCDVLSQTIHQLSTERDQLDAILQSLTDGVAVTDGVGMLTHYNGALMRMFGAVNVQSREELVSDPMIWKAFDEVYISGESQTLTYPTTADRTLWITISPVVNEEKRRTGVVGLFKDMTEMERLEKMRREYVANVSHELRTPLTAVRGLLEPLSDGLVTKEEDKQRYYKIMLHEVLRLSRLITDMLMISRLQSGTEYMELSRVDMQELVRDLATSYSAAAEQHGIELVVDAMDTPDALTDPDRIEQVLIILLDNAMRYTPSGGTISISLRCGKRLLVSVTDTGCGIPAEDLPHVFERFYKVDKSRNEGGTGLGLSIAQYIMEKLEESIWVESEVGKGTCFTFTVKRFEANAIQLGPAAQTITVHDKEEAAAVEADMLNAPFEVIKTPEKKDKPERKAKEKKKK